MSNIKTIPINKQQLQDTPADKEDEISKEELWNIIEKQRDIIQELQKALNEITLERDYLLAKHQVSTPTNSLSCSSSSSSVKTTSNEVVEATTTTTIDSSKSNNKLPVPPPRSPYRSTNTNNTTTDTQLQKNNNIPALPLKKSKLLQQQQNNGLITDREPFFANLSTSSKLDCKHNDPEEQEEEQELIPIQLRALPQHHDDFFVLSVINLKNGKELYQIEKLYTDLLFLDMNLKESTARVRNSLDFLFSETKTHDKIQRYLVNTIKDLKEDDDSMSLMYAFINQKKKEKEGYLTKRGKHHVKKHYFILNGLELVYFCTRNDGQICIGNILLVPEKTRIGKQSNQSSSRKSLHPLQQQQQTKEEESTLFQHAFIMLLDQETGGYKHILCAQSDQERDDWVKLLHTKCTVVVTHGRNKSMTHSSSKKSPLQQQHIMVRANSDTSLHPGELSNSATINIPVTSSTTRPIIRRKTYQRSSMDEQAIKRYQLEAATAAAATIANNKNVNHLSLKTSADSLPSILVDTKKNNEKQKEPTTPKERKSFFWNRKKVFANNAIESAFAAVESEANPSAAVYNMNGSTIASSTSATVNTTTNNNNYPTFGVPLDSITKKIQDLPAIAYRCIEYLQAQDAVHEEGIYRLSGSNVKINFLRNQFCEYGDVDLIQQIDLDVHVVAGLFKLWLRELPVNILTHELLDDFIRVIDVNDKQARVKQLSQLVSRLPCKNYILLRALVTHLMRIVHHTEYNKMTLRNISIVFAPTLSMPSGVFSLLMKEFDHIFSVGNGVDQKPASYTSTVYSIKSDYVAIHPLATTTSAQAYPEPSSSADRIKQLYLKKSEQEFGTKYNNESGYYA